MKITGFSFKPCLGRNLISFCRFLGLFSLVVGSRASYIGEEQIRTHEDTACDGYEMSLKCPGTDLIEVQVATYGRLDDRTCIGETSMMSNTHCSLDRAFEIVSNMCNRKRSCSFLVGQSTFPDPCAGTSKYLNTVWKCQPSAATCPGSLQGLTLKSTYQTSRDVNGAWLRDPLQHTQKIYYMGWSKYDSSQLYEYNSPQAMIESDPMTFHHLPDRVDGTGFVVYDGSMFYNKERSRTIVKFDMGKGRVMAQVDIPNANYHETSPYGIGLATDIDLAVDENGLWVIYATEANDGNMVISRLRRQTLTILNTWYTSYEKLSALNAFIACGVLYAVNYETLLIDYMFNTTSSTEKRLQISVPDLSETASAIEYNPKDRMMYIWDSGVASTYKIRFEETNSLVSNATTASLATTTIPSAMLTTTSTITTTKKPHKPHKNPSPSISGPPSMDVPGPTRYCVGVEASGLQWPNTTFSKMAFLDCPGNGPGQAIWICGGNASYPRWTTQEPDLSQCVSLWLKNLEQEIEVNRRSISELSQKLTKLVRDERTDLSSWDIVFVVNLLRRLVREAGEDVTGASDLADAVLKCTSELLHPTISHLWKALGKNMQTKTAVSLAAVLEEVAFFLAKDMLENYSGNPTQTSRDEQNKVPVTWSESYATLAIRIEPVITGSYNRKVAPTTTTSSVVTLSSGHGDSITVDDKAIIDALLLQPGDRLVVVHLSFKNLGDYMVDPRGFGSASYPVNSHIMALSVKAKRPESSWIEYEEGSMELKNPVTLQLQHRDHYFKNHVCAFWDAQQRSTTVGSWSRRGCRLVQGNATHSTCRCDHMTNFVVLSSDHEFPLMGAEQEDPRLHGISADFLNMLNIVRGGMITSIFFLVIVGITLIRHSSSLDLNTIHKNLVFSHLISELLFAIGIDLVFLPQLCTGIAVVLHYSVLTTFSWAALESFHHFVVLKDARARNYRWKYYYILGYGLPGIVVLCSAVVKLSGYDNHNVCWIDTTSGLMWAFVVPCAVGISVGVFFVIRMFHKLSKDKTRYSGFRLVKNSRIDAASSFTLLFLLCAMWCSGFLWLSGLQYVLTAWLFAFFTAAHGLACFLLYCAFDPEVHVLGRCSPWKKKSGSQFPRSVPASSLRQVPTTVNNSLMGRASTAVFTGYQYSSGNTGTSAVFDGGEGVPLVGRASGTLPPDVVVRDMIRSSSFSSSADTDPKLPTSDFPHGSTSSWNDYVHDGSRSCLANNNSQDRETYPPTAVGRFHYRLHCRHQYEEPAEESYNACTTSTAYSCCYDHLHDDQLLRNGIACRRTLCDKCKFRVNSRTKQTGCQEQRDSHLYETLGPFLVDEMSSSRRDSLSRDACSSNRHRYEDIAPDESYLQITDNHVICPQNPTLHDVQLEGVCCNRGSTKAGPNHSYGFCPCTSHPAILTRSPDLVMTSEGDSTYYERRSGRSSDPLSTDQGYDTDTQQLSHLPCRNSQSDGDGGLAYPPDVKSLSKINDSPQSHNSTNEKIINNHLKKVCRQRNSFSAGSENDREVEFINSASPAPQRSVKSFPFSNRGSSSGGRQDALSVINTSEGGRISPSDTVSSWSALAGTTARTSYPVCPVNKTNKKTTADPKIILAQARQSRDVRASLDSVGSLPAEDRANFNGYTLPGTAEAGRKARIDLRVGDVNMITNL